MSLDSLIEVFSVVHPFFNILMVFLFLYQAWMGFKIRRGRKRGQSQFNSIRRHRKLGPFLILAGLAGYCSGLVLVFINSGQLLVYPLHLAVGSLIALFLVIQYIVTRKIRGVESSWRTPHLAAGILMLCLYALQIITGLALLA